MFLNLIDFLTDLLPGWHLRQIGIENNASVRNSMIIRYVVLCK